MRFVGLRLASTTTYGGATPFHRRSGGISALWGIALWAAFSLGSACHDDNHVGRACDLGTTVTNDSTGAVVWLSQPAPECPSGICIGPVGTSGQGTDAVCTAHCGSNDDCDGEIADKNDPSDTRCKTGFVCMWPTTVGRLNCQKLCVCRDLVMEPSGGFKKPAVCP